MWLFANRYTRTFDPATPTGYSETFCLRIALCLCKVLTRQGKSLLPIASSTLQSSETAWVMLSVKSGEGCADTRSFGGGGDGGGVKIGLQWHLINYRHLANHVCSRSLIGGPSWKNFQPGGGASALFSGFHVYSNVVHTKESLNCLEHPPCQIPAGQETAENAYQDNNEPSNDSR